MKKSLLLYFPVFLICLMSCNPKNKEAATTIEDESPMVDMPVDEQQAEITGFKTIEKLAESVVKSIREKDYETYYTHVMNEKLELQQATLIQDSVTRKEFLHEYGFSLHEEKQYFENLLHFYSTKNVDLDKIVLADLEYIAYKGGKYHPLELYEVFVPIEMDYDMLIDFTVIKVEDQFYLTSELGF